MEIRSIRIEKHVLSIYCINRPNFDQENFKQSWERGFRIRWKVFRIKWNHVWTLMNSEHFMRRSALVFHHLISIIGNLTAQKWDFIYFRWWSHNYLDKNTSITYYARYKVHDCRCIICMARYVLCMPNRININVYLWVWFSVRMAFDYKHRIIDYSGCGEWGIAYVMYQTNVMSCVLTLCVLEMAGCSVFVHHAFVQITNVLTKLFTQLKSIGNAIISHLVVTGPATNSNQFRSYSTFDMICPMFNVHGRLLFKLADGKKEVFWIRNKTSLSLSLLTSSNIDYCCMQIWKFYTKQKRSKYFTNNITVDALNFQSNHNNNNKHIHCTTYNKHGVGAEQLRKCVHSFEYVMHLWWLIYGNQHS